MECRWLYIGVGHQRLVWDSVFSVDGAYLITDYGLSTGEDIRVYQGHHKATVCCVLPDGIGRIWLLVARVMLQRDDVELVAVNDPFFHHLLLHGQNFMESGEKERLKELLRERPIECG